MNTVFNPRDPSLYRLRADAQGIQRKIEFEEDPAGSHEHFVRLAKLKIKARQRSTGVRSMATPEDVAQAAMLAELEARRRGLPSPGFHPYRAMDEEIDRASSVVEVPTVVLRASLKTLSEDVEPKNSESRRILCDAARIAATLQRSTLSDVPIKEHDAVDVIESGLLLRAISELTTYRQREVIKLRYGFADGRPYTLEEIGRIFRVTRECVRQVEHKALESLRAKMGSPTWVREALIESGL